MKKAIYLITLLLFLPLISSTIIFDDWVENGETFKVEDNTFYALYIDSSESAIIKMNDLGGLMKVGECEQNEGVEYCFEEVDLGKVKIKINSLGPDISIERDLSTKKPTLQEEITVEVTITNNGEKRASDITYTDSFPSSFKTSFSGKTFSLNSGEVESFSYTITPVKITTYDTKAQLTYDFNGKQITKKSESVTIEVQKPYDLKQQLSSLAPEKNEVIEYNISIENKDKAKNLEIKQLEIIIPDKIDIKKIPSELIQNNNKWIYEGTLEKKESITFTIKIASNRVGTITLPIEADLTLSGKTFKEKLEQEFNIGLSEIVPIVNISETVKSNAPYQIHIGAKNEGKEKLTNVHIEVESDLLQKAEVIDLNPTSTHNLVKKTYTAPYLEKEKKYNVKLFGHYISVSGKNKTFEKSSQITITPAPKIISITRELEKEEFKKGERIIITVKIKNEKDIVIEDIDISDIFPKAIRSTLRGEVIKELPQLTANKEVHAYDYNVIIPKDFEEEEIEFKTVVNAKVDGELTIIKRIDKVKVLQDEEAVETPVEEEEEETTKEVNQTESETEVEETPKEEKEGVITKIINWIKNIFKGKK